MAKTNPSAKLIFAMVGILTAVLLLSDLSVQGDRYLFSLSSIRSNPNFLPNQITPTDL